MKNELRQPGPDVDGFRIHVHEVGGEVHVEFGVEVNHIPMPKESAQELAGAVFRVWRRVDPNGKIQAPLAGVTICAHEGQVLLETPVSVSQLIMTTSEARTFCLTVMETVAKLNGVAFRPEL